MMRNSSKQLDDSGSLLVETAIALPLLLLIIAATANIGAMIWEATVFTEVNRSASRTASLRYYETAQCDTGNPGAGVENHNIIKDSINQYLDSFQDNNFTSGKKSWEIQPRILYTATGWRGQRFDSNDPTLAPHINFRFGMIIIENNPNQPSCKFCLSNLLVMGIFDVFNVRTTSIFLLPDACTFGQNTGGGQGGDGSDDDEREGDDFDERGPDFDTTGSFNGGTDSNGNDNMPTGGNGNYYDFGTGEYITQ
jgi:hypothetical protein